ncbi:MAG TPA: hypothetical protein PKI01_03915 [Bacteroidales bacterium]|nr:hypothetical protein [Bacteroidales bacterium]
MNYFVYVVCGAVEYIEQLNFSLRYLKYFSRYPILVVTDKSRNEAVIEHEKVIDIKTPENLNNHQAHLFLETKLPKYLGLKENEVCCYLDSDIIAVSERINEVFEHFKAPVTFAIDHCSIDFFSPQIMNCGCAENFKKKKALYREIIHMLPTVGSSEDCIRNANELSDKFRVLKKKPLSNGPAAIKYLFQRYLSRKTEFTFFNFTFKRPEHCWYDSAGNIVGFDFNYYNKVILKKTGAHYNGYNWINKNKEVIKPELPYCGHLREYLNQTYNISIPQNFRHWNGGVFLFGPRSKDFMDYWHQATMDESFNGNIKYYDDQGTLVLTNFKFGTEKNPSLPVRFNFIADYNNPATRWDSERGFTYDDYKTIFSPAFLHIYHHWGDESWDIWQSVIGLGQRLKIMD